MATARVITLPKAVRSVVNEQGDVVLRPFGSDIQDLRGMLLRGRKRAVPVETMNRAILREHI